MSDNPNAFPVYAGNEDFTDGMTLRDYFAASILQGMIATGDQDLFKYIEMAERAYKQANAMLKVRENYD